MVSSIGNESRVLVLEAINAFFAAIGFSSAEASTIPNTFFLIWPNYKPNIKSHY